MTLSGGTIGYTGPAVTGTTDIVVDGTDSAGNAEALEIPTTIAADSIQVEGAATTVSLSALADSNFSSTVKFTVTSSKSANTVKFAETNLPTGLVTGDPVLTYVDGTAAPGTYTNVKVTATDSDGAVLSGVFNLVVKANAVFNSGSYGDTVNPFGNGFDVYQQRKAPGALIGGWTATQADPATHFLSFSGSHAGAIRFEYAPNGSATGLCVADPGGGWKSDPLRDGLILATCNNGPWQQFVPQSDGTLQNVATRLFFTPDGPGAQLRGATAATSWGGSVYSWAPFSALPQ